VLVRAAPLTGPHVDGGYAVTVQTAPAADLTGVAMPAWNLTPREPDVAALIIEGRSSDDIAASMSCRRLRAQHTKAIFGKVGVHNCRHLTAALTGQPGEAAAQNRRATKASYRSAGIALRASVRKRPPWCISGNGVWSVC
jgi:DNA-binding CsgD family transcriptional regulator